MCIYNLFIEFSRGGLAADSGEGHDGLNYLY